RRSQLALFAKRLSKRQKWRMPSGNASFFPPATYTVSSMATAAEYEHTSGSGGYGTISTFRSSLFHRNNRISAISPLVVEPPIHKTPPATQTALPLDTATGKRPPSTHTYPPCPSLCS